MPLDIQVGTLADRLRNLLNLSGRIPLRLDETTVPVAVAGDATEVPYALDPVHLVYSNVAPAVALEHSGLAIALPAAASGSLVIDRVYLDNEGGSGIVYLLVLDNIALLVAAGLTDFGPLTRVNGLDPQVLAANVLQATAAHELIGSDAAAGIHLGFTVGRLTVPTADTRVVEGPWVLPSGGALAVWADAVNTPVRPTFHGRYFASVRG